jgi:hypothetical protein
MKVNEIKSALCKRWLTKYKPIQNNRHRDEGGSVEEYGLRDNSAFCTVGPVQIPSMKTAHFILAKKNGSILGMIKRLLTLYNL